VDISLLPNTALDLLPLNSVTNVQHAGLDINIYYAVLEQYIIPTLLPLVNRNSQNYMYILERKVTEISVFTIPTVYKSTVSYTKI